MDRYNTPRIPELYYQYVVAHKQMWPKGFTRKRLEDVKNDVLSDRFIMEDLFSRHGAAGLFPEELREEDSYLFDHGMSNFVSNILYKMIEKGIYKP